MTTFGNFRYIVEGFFPFMIIAAVWQIPRGLQFVEDVVEKREKPDRPYSTVHAWDIQLLERDKLIHEEKTWMANNAWYKPGPSKQL